MAPTPLRKKRRALVLGMKGGVCEASSGPDVEFGGACREEDLELRRDI